MPFTTQNAALNGSKGGKSNKSIRRFKADPTLATEAVKKRWKYERDSKHKAQL